MDQIKRRGFISASCLILLLVCLLTTLSLSKGLGVAVQASIDSIHEINGRLAFEENLIRLSQGKSFKPWQKGPYQVMLREIKDQTFLQLLNGDHIEEALCIEKEPL